MTVLHYIRLCFSRLDSLLFPAGFEEVSCPVMRKSVRGPLARDYGQSLGDEWQANKRVGNFKNTTTRE